MTDRVLIEHPVPEAQELLPSMVGRVAVVTGASSGLGIETAKWLALRGCDEVVLAVRNTAKADGVVDDIVAEWGEQVPDLRSRLVVMKLDLADLSSVRAFAAAMAERHSHLDILVNNAGINIPLGRTTVDGFEMMYGTNHIGPVCLTAELMPLLLAAPNRAVVSTCSSGGADSLAPAGLVPDTDEGLTQWPAYGRSKAANLVFTVELQRRLLAAGIDHVRAMSSHPGWTYTGLVDGEGFLVRMLNKMFSQNVQMGTTPQLASVGAGLLPADHPNSASTHAFFGPRGCKSMRGPPHEMPMFREDEVKDVELGTRLWDLTNEAIGIDSWAFDSSDRIELP
ncbi:dehydrogenase [Thecamonas trahens ATCC 50062]|uniref:Dehydrogenase n=1 Tax=Thecamonas trahens ATCC 50062 TaxID=461836 RepID=A0A0L0DCN7_THETB|nr:dehydrogenase [Thecamonas trahens ATCC 50062]KNC50079.1 dehydrogenase [Thecamonas trahens ATCC 50062]|eukprot:XP_013757243.1 dehydrogenase [Thecamonas trahens ATCC 50062]